jgi:hypothetical protein
LETVSSSTRSCVRLCYYGLNRIAQLNPDSAVPADAMNEPGVRVASAPVTCDLMKRKLCRCHDLSVDEILHLMALIDQIPTHHPLVGSH